MTSIEITVLGTPAPQGSKHGYAVKAKGEYTGKVAQVESSAKVKPWRMAVKYAALAAMSNPWPEMVGPLSLMVTFRLARPKGHYSTGRNTGILKASAPTLPGVRPDLDKLLRSTFDALGEAHVWGDDSQVTDVHASKMYADYDLPGATIRVNDVEQVAA